MAWTQAQQAAITARDCGVIVSAAAGSGKTSVLVERLLQILTEDSPEKCVPADRMIVVTFTNDAAAEMKARLSQALALKLQQNPENHWLYQQQILLQSAHICTISSFCFDLIRDNLTESGITSSFRILNDTESLMMASKAADQVLNRWHRDRKVDMDLLWNRFCEKNDLPLEQILLDLHQFLGSVPFRKQWCDDVLEQLNQPSEKSVYHKRILEQLRTLAENAAKQASEAAVRADGLYDSVVENTVLPWVEEDCRCITKIQKRLTAADMNTKKLLLPFYALKEKRGKKTFPRKKKTIVDPQGYEQVKHLRVQYRAKMQQLVTLCETILPYEEADLIDHRHILPLFLEMEKELSEEIWQMKVQKNALGFEDGEHFALELLAVPNKDGSVLPSPLAKELSTYYKLIMIDEYQDSNNKQDMIFKLLSHHCVDPETGSLCYGDNVFLVGDVKQSIYRFRLANPKNFVRAIHAAASENRVCRHIALNRNFRSTPSVLHFVNFVCGHLMSPSCGDVTYDDSEALDPGSSIGEILPKEQQAVHVAILHQQELYIIRQIQKMIQDESLVVEKDGSTRPCRYSDFCILLRNNTLCQKISHALEDAGIPAQSPEEKGYLRAREISILLDMLRVLDNPLSETSLAAIMLSPMFWFSAQELLQIRMLAPQSSLYFALCCAAGVNEEAPKETKIEAVLREKCQYLYETIQKLRQNAGMMSLEALIRCIYDRTDFLSVIQLTEDGDQKRANLQLLLQYIRQYEANTDVARNGISGFLKYIDWLLESGNDFQQTSMSVGAENAVVIKTMHRSKGLEFPFVFLGDLEVRFSGEEKRKNALFSDSGMVGFCLKDPTTYTRAKTLPFMVIGEENQKQSKSEELRLLYVAMTRAKQQLFLPLDVGKIQTKTHKYLEEFASSILPSGELPPDLVQSADSMAQWIWMCLVLLHEKELDAILPLPPCTWEKPRWCDDIQICYESNVPEFEPISIAEETTSEDANPAVVKEIQKMISFSCRSKDSDRKSLLSVSAVQTAKHHRAPTWKRPTFLQAEKRLTGTERGTAIHAFFQYANFQNVQNNLSDELMRLKQHGFLTAAQAAEITSDIVNAFFQDAIYYRFQKSHHIMREKKFLVRCSDLQQFDEMDTILARYRNSDSMLKGIIDMAFEENGAYIVVDYKTDHVQDEKILVQEYREQLLIYCAAISCMTKKPVAACYLYSTHFKKSILVKGKKPSDHDEFN